MSFLFRVSCFLFCFFLSYSVSAQDSLVAAQQPSVAFPEDLDSLKMDSFFQMHAIDLSRCDNPKLYTEIYQWYRTRYHYGGNSAKGIDCSHFVNMLYTKIYGRQLNGSAASIFPQCKVVKGGIDEAAEGDLVFFKIKKKRISHIAIYLQHGKFAHATTQAGVIISDITEPYYKRHFYKVGRIEE